MQAVPYRTPVGTDGYGESVNAAERTIGWLYREQLQIDETWSVRTATGFTWWTDQNAPISADPYADQFTLNAFDAVVDHVGRRIRPKSP